MDPIVQALLNNLGAGGIMLAAIYIIANRLAKQYESRIAALEKASARCEEDRVKLRDLIINHFMPQGGDRQK